MAASPSLILSRRDLDFLLFEWLDVTGLLDRPRFAEHSRHTFAAVLDLAEELATERFAPHNKKADATEPRIAPDGTVVLIEEIGQALQAFAKTGLMAATFDEQHGGMQLPTSVAKAVLAWFQAANVGTSAYPFLTMANANCLIEHGSAEQVATWVEPMLAGRFFGTMALSEPQAGSSLADITTRAEPQPDGTYRLFGNKMWISGGDHELSENIVHLVLAKVPGGPSGVKGISMFVVPKILLTDSGQLGERNDVVLAGLNHKMGYRATTNTLLNFGEGVHRPAGSPGAVGYLVGELHHGLSYMFSMMNEARIGVGLGATALGYTGYLHALDYARTRVQGRSVAGAGPVAIIEHPDVRRMLLAAKSYVEGALALGLYCAALVDEQATATSVLAREEAGLLLQVLTPIAKAWPSQWCLAANDLAIQIHGGYGYTRDYDVEQFYRDNRLNPIHEGTNGIQALDLLGRKVPMAGGAGLRLLLERVGRTIERATAGGDREDGGYAGYAAELQVAVDRIARTTATLLTCGDTALMLSNATAYLEAVGHTVIAWLWLDQVLSAGSESGAFYEGKRAAARYFYAWELPSVHAKLDLLDRLDRTLLDTPPEAC
ncbi:acyl-CoA dehydrogenase [Jatrophihabitans telluris]|uniref:Acyl-CoA dehydrogenase n=1 Tax=Jatrophihabitans telluris TaxID=2038343 RepID=A0ABY4QZQ8_9ACTN|nr:acyl-CoA dehydrogenase [Jatrophihabitans telluris]UQX88491.1 acyl-CoA dehydrogenase [Jatrophihabitans telluris]